MSKLLSICIPSYNMEQYLHRCVDSMLVDEVLEQLEIIIVNDGSKDSTLAIANDYKQRYPQSVVVIDKPNGHYGSCINASLKIATGKYFRIVDADDWVDSQALVTLVHTLETLDVDCVCTRYAICWEGNDNVEIQTFEAPFNTTLDLNQFILPNKCFHMHCLTYSTILLKRIGYVQTEGVCYTDLEYVYVPLSCARNIFFIDITLYQYLLGRDGQTVDGRELINNNSHYIKVLESLERVRKLNLPFNVNEPSICSFVMSNVVEVASMIYISNYDYDLAKEKLFRRVIADMNRSDLLKFSDLWSKNRIAILKLWYYSGTKLSKYIIKPFKERLKL